MPVGLVLVSHSARLADGTAELAAQMAPGVTIVGAGGTDEGSIGTSFDAVMSAITAVDSDDGTVLLYDLGSALLTAETALEFLDPAVAGRVRIVDAPLVEGAVTAAVAAQGGADLDAVAAAAAEAGRPAEKPSGGPTPTTVRAGSPADSAVAADGVEQAAKQITATVSVVNPLGLHARPVAALIRALSDRDVEVRIGRPGGPSVDLRSVLRVVALALRGGDVVEITAGGRDAGLTTAALTALITGGFGEAERPAGRRPAVGMGVPPARMGNAPAARRPLDGTAPTLKNGSLAASAGAPGLAIGPLVRLDRAPIQITGNGSGSANLDVDGEKSALTVAIDATAGRLAHGNEFEVAHAALLGDPELRSDALDRLDQGGTTAAAAWWSAVGAMADSLAADPDELVAARAVDVREAGTAVLAEFGVVVDRIPLDLVGKLVFADDLGPGEVPVLVERGAVGVVLSRGSATAHAVIVARGLGLPMALRAGDALGTIAPGTPVILDGDTGLLTVDPTPEEADRVTSLISDQAAGEVARRAAAQGLVRLADGREVLVVANIGSLADARAAVSAGADGVGLLRTELLVLDRDTYPDEDAQTDDLQAIFEVLGDRPIVVRVLDAGGDKPVTALALDAEHNGFLGVRGLRYLLAHPDLLHAQLRAICRAGLGHRVSVMAPMVTIAAEVVAFRSAVDRAVQSLVDEGIGHRPPEKVGVMIEVPAAALAADEICAVSDFVSVGSNDLTSYTMAADRTLAGVAELLDPGSTALQRLLDQLCSFALAAGTPVAVCGEIAGMAEFAIGLVDRGVHELSVAPARIPVVKELLRAQRG